MNFKQYVDEQRSRYEAFAETIKTIIEVVLNGNPSVGRPQQIQTRAKSSTSLARKLKERGLERSRSIEKEIKDLAGVRLIFYTNSDERSFLNSGLINDNFHVDYDASKVHHPIGTPADVNEQYRGLHYVLSLKEDRLNLPEYSRFAGLRCEIQIQTILNHAWSETAHDILYHRPEGASGFGTKQYDRIHKRMSGIMEKYLVPAGHEFEKVHHDFRRLMSGKALFDQGIVAVIQSAADNNELCETIERIRKEVLPLCDDVSLIAAELRNALVEAVERSRTTEIKPIDVGPGFGLFAGKSATDVAEAALQIITDLRYVDVPATFSALLVLYRGAISEEERKHILESVKKLAEYHFGALRKVGPAIQANLIETITTTMGGSDGAEYKPVVRCVCENVLKSEVHGVSSETYDTVSLQTGAVNGTNLLAETRQKALDILLDVYSNSYDLVEKRQCYQAASSAMNLPNVAQYGDSLWLLVIRDTKRILEFFAKQGPVPPYSVLQDLERHCRCAFQNAVGVRNVKPQNRPVITAYEDLLPLIGRFRMAINNDKNYAIFKTFAGFDPVFEDDLSKEDHDWRRKNSIREARMGGYLSEITEATADEWLLLVLEISKEPDSNQHLGAFLDRVGVDRPLIALKWLPQPHLPTHLRAALLFGALKSSERKAATTMVSAWIAEGIYLAASARVIHYGNDALDELLPSLAHKALTVGDLDALEELIPSFIKRSQKLDSSLVNTFLLPAIHLLAKGRRWYWLMQIYPGDEQQFLERLTEGQTESLLADFVDIPRIDYHEEVFLKPIAKSRPMAVLNMFRARTQHKDENRASYDAIPFFLHELSDALASNPELVISTIKAWYAADNRLFEYKGGRLLALIFPSFSEAFGNALQAVIKRDHSAIEFVLSVLQNYQGEPALHETFKVIISLLPEKDAQLLDIERALEATGVVSGEFGFVEAYQAKRGLVEPWLKDKRPRVRKFAERFIRSLNRAIAAEQRRAEADLELRKHDFDPDAD